MNDPSVRSAAALMEECTRNDSPTERQKEIAIYGLIRMLNESLIPKLFGGSCRMPPLSLAKQIFEIGSEGGTDSVVGEYLLSEVVYGKDLLLHNQVPGLVEWRGNNPLPQMILNSLIDKIVDDIEGRREFYQLHRGGVNRLKSKEYSSVDKKPTTISEWITVKDTLRKMWVPTSEEESSEDLFESLFPTSRSVDHLNIAALIEESGIVV